MYKLILIFTSFILSACGQQTLDNKQNKILETLTKDTVSYYEVGGKAILLGKSINLIDSAFYISKNINDYNEQIVEIGAISNNYYKLNKFDDYCDEFKYVQIKCEDFKGIVDGRNVFFPIKSLQNKTLEYNGNKIEFIATENGGIGADDENGLTGCTINTPVYFIDKNAKYEGVIKMVTNNYYNDDFPYLELKFDDTANDEIEKIEVKDGKYYLKINRSYQEGRAEILIEIKNKNSEFTAEIIKLEKFE